MVGTNAAYRVQLASGFVTTAMRTVSYIRAHEDEISLPSQAIDENWCDHDHKEILLPVRLYHE